MCMLMCMRTNIVIDDELIAEAMRCTGAPTKRAVVDLALREIVARHRRRATAGLRGRIDWDEDLDDLRRDRDLR